MSIARLANGNFNVFFLLPLCEVDFQLHSRPEYVIHLTLSLHPFREYNFTYHYENHQAPPSLARGWNYDFLSYSEREKSLYADCLSLIWCMVLATRACEKRNRNEIIVQQEKQMSLFLLCALCKKKTPLSSIGQKSYLAMRAI